MSTDAGTLTAREAGTPPKGILERILAPLGDVRGGGGVSVLLMALVMFLILGALYMLKTAREIFILTEGGAAVKSYSSAGRLEAGRAGAIALNNRVIE